MKRILSATEILVILLLAIVPLFANFPYRINIFLSWEGAYRLAEGQLPYRDFGMPVGYMYWIIPALFFKIFGAKLFTLIYAQAFINIIGGLSFRSIFRSLEFDQPLRFTAILLFCVSYSFLNYWPWYNHTVIIYQIIALAFLFYYLNPSHIRNRYLALVGSGVFIFFSFFTKQDGGGLGLLICLALLAYDFFLTRKWKALLVFSGSLMVTALIMILPLPSSGMTYWFNHGQYPHSSRISVRDILSAFLGASQWIKFYLFIIVLLLWATIHRNREFLNDRKAMTFTLLTLGILAEAAIFQVTSYVPEDNNIFFHSFAMIYILWLLLNLLAIDFRNWGMALTLSAGILLWWSPVFWRYIERFLIPPATSQETFITHEGYRYSTQVNKNTFMIELDTTDIPQHLWRIPSLKAFDRILLPGPTVDGIERLMANPAFKNRPDLKVLNMSELTPLAAELPFKLETGPYYPLWYHKGVSMFEKETKMFVDRIQNNHYDLVLFEYIPYLNNFYPYEVREALQKNYKRIDIFPAPRKPASHAWVEVYIPK